MPVITEDLDDVDVELLRWQSHPRCVVCSQSNATGLGLEFHVADDGVVEATFDCESMFQGYPNVLHGGIIASLLDGAMTNCLFAHGCCAVTAELSVRFRHPIVTGSPAVVRARIESSAGSLSLLVADVSQKGRVMATAKGKFVEKPDARWPEGR
jgi:uncharacterized protein (TIGR00369 family)